MALVLPGGNNGDVRGIAQQQAAKEAAIMHFIEATTIQIYANLVSRFEFAGPNEFKKAAQSAKNAAPFLAAELGMVHIEVQEEDNDE